MVSFTTTLLSLASLGNSEEIPSGVIHFPLTRKNTLAERVHSIVKRSESPNLELDDRFNLFTAELNIGSQNDTVQVQVDTGSSDLWLMDNSNPYCSSITSSFNKLNDANNQEDGGKILCWSATMFDPTKSSTYKKNDTSFSVAYGDYTFANGTYAHDDISFGGITIEGGNFALATQANSSFAVWGIGLPATEGSAILDQSTGAWENTYPNLPLQMVQQGLISSYGYSLWLNDVDATTGSLLFGGVDHAKYKGSLQTVPIISEYEGADVSRLMIMLNGISIYQGSNTAQVASLQYPALLDSGTTIMQMPSVIADAIAGSLDAQYTQGTYVVTCGIEGGLTFDFSGAKINVPFDELLIPLGEYDACIIGIQPNDQFFILGDTFLRSAYVVYDLQNLEISIANTNYNITSSSIEALGSSVPSATRASGYSNTKSATTYSTSVITNLDLPSGNVATGDSGGGGFGGGGFGGSIPTGGYGGETIITTIGGGFPTGGGEPTGGSNGGSSTEGSHKNDAPHSSNISVVASVTSVLMVLFAFTLFE